VNNGSIFRPLDFLIMWLLLALLISFKGALSC